MSNRGLSPRTVQGAHWVLNAAFRQALRWEMILEVPTKGVKLPRIRRREMRVFSVEEAKIFLKVALPTMYGTLFALAVTLECAQRVHRSQVAGHRLGTRNSQREENITKGSHGTVGIW